MPVVHLHPMLSVKQGQWLMHQRLKGQILVVGVIHNFVEFANCILILKEQIEKVCQLLSAEGLNFDFGISLVFFLNQFHQLQLSDKLAELGQYKAQFPDSLD